MAGKLRGPTTSHKVDKYTTHCSTLSPDGLDGMSLCTLFIPPPPSSHSFPPAWASGQYHLQRHGPLEQWFWSHQEGCTPSNSRQGHTLPYCQRFKNLRCECLCTIVCINTQSTCVNLPGWSTFHSYRLSKHTCIPKLMCVYIPTAHGTIIYSLFLALKIHCTYFQWDSEEVYTVSVMSRC